MAHHFVLDELADWLAKLAPKEVLEFRTSKQSQKRLNTLLEKNKTSVGLTKEENDEVEQFMLLNHIVSVAKAKALLNLRRSGLDLGTT